MKQQKKPFLLVTIVVTLVVVLLGVNMSQYLRDPNRIKQQKAPNAETVAKMQARQAQVGVPEDVRIEDMIEASSMQTMGGRGSQVAVGEVPVQPSILLPRLQDSRTQYQVDSTSTLWWKEDSKQLKTAEERAGLYQGSDK